MVVLTSSIGKYAAQLLLFAAPAVVLADPAFFCQNKQISDFSAYGDVEMYEGCGDVCDCSIFELLCLVRSAETGQFTFESVSYEFASNCDFTECLCNIVDGWSDASRPATSTSEPLPSPLLIGLPHYDDLVSLASSDDS